MLPPDVIPSGVGTAEIPSRGTSCSLTTHVSRVLALAGRQAFNGGG